MILDRLHKSRIAVIFLILFIDLIGFGMIIPLMPYLASKFGGSAAQVGWLLAIYSLMQFIFSPIWGRLSDRIGRRPVLLWSLFASGLAYVGFAFSTSYEMLFLSRMLAGIATANISTAMAYVADITTTDQRSKGLGLVGAAIGLGFIFGPFLGGILSDTGLRLGADAPFGLGFPALVAGGICFFNLIFAYRILVESRKPDSSESNHLSPLGRLSILLKYFRWPVVGPLMVVLLLSGLAMAHMESTLGLFVKDKLNWDVKQASFAFAYVGLIMVFTQGYLIRKVMPRYGERKLMVVGLILSSFGMLGIALTSQVADHGASVAVIALAMTFLSFGIGLVNPSLSGSISVLLPKDQQGVGLGLSQSLSALGRILGPIGGGLAYQWVGQPAPFALAALFMFAGLVIAFFIYSRLPELGLKKRNLKMEINKI
jgi:DHA1 family tetracycline resistance protein-like MFS transporter